MAAKKKAEKAKEPPFFEQQTAQLEVKSRGYRALLIDVNGDGVRLGERAGDPDAVVVEWDALPNFMLALARAQEIHAGRKTAELPLFGAPTQDDQDEDPEDEEEDPD